jgi:hypothetical protein
MISFHQLAKALFLTFPITFLSFISAALADSSENLWESVGPGIFTYSEGRSYGKCTKFIDASEDVTSKCDPTIVFSVPPPSQKDAPSYRKYPQFAAPTIAVSRIYIDVPGKIVPVYRVQFGLSGYKRVSGSEIIFTIDQVITNGANGVAIGGPENHLPARGTCIFQRLKPQNPTAICNAQVGSKKYSASFTADASKNPPGSDSNLALQSWQNFVSAAMQFIDYR